MNLDIKNLKSTMLQDFDEQNRKDLIHALKNDQAVRAYFLHASIPMEVIDRLPYQVQHWQKEAGRCLGCRSLSMCRQPARGYRAGLSYDGILHDEVEACPYEIERLHARSHLKQYRVSDLGEEFAEASFEKTDLSHEEKAYKNAFGAAGQLAMEEKGCYLYGPMGTGKTYLAACASNYMAKQGKTCAFVHWPSFCDRLAARMKSGESSNEQEILGYADMLVIDDIGAESLTERNRAVLLSILDRRMQNRRMTWFTSNEDFHSLEAHFASTYQENPVAAARLMERIRTLAEPLKVTGRDRRHLFQTSE